jgi:hypothetical protein
MEWARAGKHTINSRLYAAKIKLLLRSGLP